MWGPKHSPMSRPSGFQSPCWGLLCPRVLANCGSPESYFLIPPHADLSRTVPALLQVGTVSASLCHPYLWLFRKFTRAQLVTSVLLELLDGEISQDGEMPDLPGYTRASWGTAQHPRAPHPIPDMLGTTGWAVWDAGSSPCPAQGSEADFHTLPALLVCLQAGNPNRCSKVRKALSCPAPLGVQPSHLLGLHPAKHLSAHSSLSEISGTTHALNSKSGITRPTALCISMPDSKPCSLATWSSGSRFFFF